MREVKAPTGPLKDVGVHDAESGIEKAEVVVVEVAKKDTGGLNDTEPPSID